VQALQELHEHGVDTLAVVALDSPFAMHAWQQQLGVTPSILFLSDPKGQLLKGLGAVFEAGPLGTRGKR
jgi:peroxiredoxin